MQTIIRRFLRQGQNGILSILFACTLSLGAVAGFTSGTTSALSCSAANFIFCGLDQRSTQNSIVSVQKIYHDNIDDNHHDIRTGFRWAGADDAAVAAMNTSNTKQGTLFRNGDVKVGNKVVAQDSWVVSRINGGNGFTQISPGVWARKTTTSFAHASAPVIVHFNQSGAADWAVMTDCGNPVKFTSVMPTPPKPHPQQQQQAPQLQSTMPIREPRSKPSLACLSLSATKTDSEDNLTYSFTAQAAAKNTDIVKYIFSFGDDNSSAVITGTSSTTVSHTYPSNNSTFTARVSVFSTDFMNGRTSKGCTVTITTPASPTAITNNTTTVTPAVAATPATPVIETPEAPTTSELPHTGASTAAGIVGLFGASSIAGILGYHFWSRRKLRL